MSVKRFFIVSLLQMVVFFILKYFFFKFGFAGNLNISYAYWGLTLAISTWVAGYLGVINFLEAAFVAVVWFGMDIFCDLVLTSALFGLEIFVSKELWIGYVVMMMSVFWFHKKRHIELRKQMHHH